MSIFSRFRGDEVQRQIERLGLGHKPHEIRAAMSALLDIGERAVVPLIQILLNQEQPYIVRCRVAGTLAMLKDGRATEPLINTLRDSNAQVRWHALKALEKLGARSAVPELRRMAESDEGEFSIMPTLHIVLKDAAREAVENIEAAGRR